MENKLGIVLLNYKNYEDTINCIKSILLQTYNNYEIIVVDNDSQNESVEKIKETIKQNDKVHFINNDKNLGFAKGNNVGINYAINKLKCDFIFVLNTDTILKDKDTLKKLIFNYNKEQRIGVINPMCCSVEGQIQRPYLICKSNIYLCTLRIGIYLLAMLLKLIFKIKKTNTKHNSYDITELNNKKYIIQGCSYILTPEYFRYYNQLYPETFLYCEELALCILLDKAKLKTVTDTKVIIIHKEGGSSGVINIESKKRKIKNQLHSYFKVVKLIFLKYKQIKNKFFA